MASSSSKSPGQAILLLLLLLKLLQQGGSFAEEDDVVDEGDEGDFEEEAQDVQDVQDVREDGNDWREMDIDTAGRVYTHTRHTVARSASSLLGARLRQERRMLLGTDSGSDGLGEAGQFYGLSNFGGPGGEGGGGGGGQGEESNSDSDWKTGGHEDLERVLTDECVDRAEVDIVNHLTVYRVGQKLASAMAADDTFDLKIAADCTGQPWAAGVKATPMVNSTDPLGESSAVFHLSRPPPSGLSYVCWTSDKPGLPRCAASIERGPPRTPLRILMENIPITDTQDHIRLLKHIDELEEMWDLIVVQWLFLIAVAVWILSILHACYVVMTLRTILPPREVIGLESRDSQQSLLGSLFMMLTFATGVVTMVSLSLKVMFTGVEQWLVDSILAAASLAGLLGLVLLYRDMCTRQLFHAALQHGICITGERKLGIGDMLVFSGLMLVSGFIVLGILSLPVYPQELAGCVSGFLGVSKVLQQLMEGRKKRRHGICEVELVKLAKTIRALDGEIKKDGASSSASESPRHHHEEAPEVKKAEDDETKSPPLNLVDMMREQPIVHLDMFTFLQSCRQRVDPLVAMEKHLKDMAESQSGEDDGELSEISDLSDSKSEKYKKTGAYQLPDLRWHAHYVHAKTGSIAPHFNLVVVLGMMVYMLYHLLVLLFRYRTLAPSLNNLSSPVGVLFPPFDPEIREYTYLHDRGLQSFPFFAEGNEELVQRKDFIVNGQLVAKQNISEHVDISAAEQSYFSSRYPMQLNLNVFGGLESRSTQYRIVFSEVTTRVTTMMVTVGRWRRCVFWGKRKDLVAAIPTITRSDRIVNIELATLAYAADVPRGLDQLGQVKEPGLITFFKKIENVTSSACSTICREYPGCVKFKAGQSGCYFGMWATRSDNCTEMHDIGKAASNDSPLGALQKTRWLRASLCPEWDRREGCSSSVVGPSGKVLFRDVKLVNKGHSLFALTMINEKGNNKAAQQKQLWSQEIRLSQGAPLPRRVFLAGPKFIKLARTRVQDDLLTIALAAYDLHDCPPTFQIVVAPLGDDPAFDISFEDFTVKTVISQSKSVSRLDRSSADEDDEGPGSDGPGRLHRVGGSGNSPREISPMPLPPLDTLDLWLCDQKYQMKHIWLCNNGTSGKRVPYMILTVEKYRPTKSMATILVRPKPDMPDVQQIQEKRLRIAVRTQDGKVPLRWGLEKNCKLDLLDAPSQVVPSLLGGNIMEAGLCRCSNITMEWRDENKRSVSSSISIASFLGIAVQLHKVDSWIARFLEAVAENPYNVIQKSLGKRAEGWTKLGVTASRHGITISTENLKQFCGIFSSSMAAGREVVISWVTLLLHVRPESPFWWEFLGMGSGLIAPSDIAASMAFLTEGVFFGILPRIQASLTKWDEDFKTPYTSPTIIAIQKNWPEFLRTILEVVPHVVVLGEGATSWASYHLWERAMEYNCSACLDIIADAYVGYKDRCAGRASTKTYWESIADADTARFHLGCSKIPVQQTDVSAFSVFSLRRPQVGDFSTVGNLVQKWFKLRRSSTTYEKATALDFRDLSATNGDLVVLLPYFESLPDLCGDLLGLYFDNNRLDFCSDPKAAAAISSLVEKSPNVKTISLNGNKLCDQGFMELLPGFQRQLKFERISLVKTRITATTVKAISEISSWTPTFKFLDVSNNDVGLQGLIHLCEGNLPKLATLIMENTGMTDVDDYDAVKSSCAGKFPWLAALQISNNQIGNHGLAKLLVILTKQHIIRQIFASNTGLFKEGFDLEAYKKLGLPPVRVLKLSGNALGEMGPRLAAAFGGIHELDLSNTGIPAAGATQVVNMLGRMPELAKLNLTSNPIRTRGLKEIVDGLVNVPNGFFGYLYAADTCIMESPEIKGLFEALGTMTKLKALDLSYNNFDVKHLSETKFADLPRVHTLKLNRALDPYRVSGDTADSEFFFDFLKNWRTLNTLEVDHNGLKSLAMHKLLLHICHKFPGFKRLSFKDALFDIRDVEELGRNQVCSLPILEYINADFSACELKRLTNAFPKMVALNRNTFKCHDCDKCIFSYIPDPDADPGLAP